MKNNWWIIMIVVMYFVAIGFYVSLNLRTAEAQQKINVQQRLGVHCG